MLKCPNHPSWTYRRQDLHFAEEGSGGAGGNLSQEGCGGGVQVGPELLPGQPSRPTPTAPGGWARAHLHGGDLREGALVGVAGRGAMVVCGCAWAWAWACI